MRASYKNPKELATAIKDAVDSYLEDLISREQLEAKILRMKEVNGERMVRNNLVHNKVALIIGEERANIINEIIG